MCIRCKKPPTFTGQRKQKIKMKNIYFMSKVGLTLKSKYYNNEYHYKRFNTSLSDFWI